MRAYSCVHILSAQEEREDALRPSTIVYQICFGVSVCVRVCTCAFLTTEDEKEGTLGYSAVVILVYFGLRVCACEHVTRRKRRGIALVENLQLLARLVVV